jgi:hypothetical protein
MPHEDPKSKRARSRLPAPVPTAAPQEPAPLTPVTPKIGEGRGNLKGRADAFTSRRGKSK